MPSSFASGIPETRAARSRPSPDRSSVTSGTSPIATLPLADSLPPPNPALKSSMFNLLALPDRARESSVAVMPATEILGEAAFTVIEGESVAPFSVADPSSTPVRGTPNPPTDESAARSAFEIVTVRSSPP